MRTQKLQSTPDPHFASIRQLTPSRAPRRCLLTRAKRVAVGPVLALLFVAFVAERPAVAQKPTFEIEGVVSTASRPCCPA